MKICHISDTHFGSSSHHNAEALEELLNEIREGDFDFLIHTGDVTQSGRLDEYKMAQEFFKKLNVPYVAIPGNHDARNGGVRLFEEYIGPSNGLQETNDAIIIYVDSSVMDSNEGRVGMVKYDMMREALNEYIDKSLKIVAIHHHTIPIPMAGRERNVLSNAGDILDLLLKSDVDLVLSGHRHFPNVHEVESTLFINAGTSAGRKTRYGDVNSYDIVEIDADTKRVTTKRLDGRVSVKEYPRQEQRIFSDMGKKLFSIAHMSNTFITDSRPFLYNHFINAVNKINKIEPDLVVHCGGVVKEGIPSDYELASNLMSKLKSPVYYTPAGRDINYLGYDLFPKHFGDIDQTYSDGDIVLKGVSTAQYDSPIGIVGKTERKALISDIKSREEDFKGIFLHHNLLPIPHSREKGLLEDAGDMLREVVDADIDLVLTGTSSHPHAARVGETVIVNANSMSSVYQRSIRGNSFNLIDIYEKVVAVYEINSLWGTKRLKGMWSRV